MNYIKVNLEYVQQQMDSSGSNQLYEVRRATPGGVINNNLPYQLCRPSAGNAAPAG